MKYDDTLKKHAKKVVYVSLVLSGLYVFGMKTIPFFEQDLPSWVVIIALVATFYIFNMMFGSLTSMEKEKQDLEKKISLLQRELSKAGAGMPQKKKPLQEKKEDPFNYEFGGG